MKKASVSLAEVGNTPLRSRRSRRVVGAVLARGRSFLSFPVPPSGSRCVSCIPSATKTMILTLDRTPFSLPVAQPRTNYTKQNKNRMGFPVFPGGQLSLQQSRSSRTPRTVLRSVFGCFCCAHPDPLDARPLIKDHSACLRKDLWSFFDQGLSLTFP